MKLCEKCDEKYTCWLSLSTTCADPEQAWKILYLSIQCSDTGVFPCRDHIVHKLDIPSDGVASGDVWSSSILLSLAVQCSARFTVLQSSVSRT